jgi:hypothetical protein
MAGFKLGQLRGHTILLRSRQPNCASEKVVDMVHSAAAEPSLTAHIQMGAESYTSGLSQNFYFDPRPHHVVSEMADYALVHLGKQAISPLAISPLGDC